MSSRTSEFLNDLCGYNEFDFKCPSCGTENIEVIPIDVPFTRKHIDNSDIREKGYKIKDALHISKALKIANEYFIDCRDCEYAGRVNAVSDPKQRLKWIRDNGYSSMNL